MAKVSRIIGEQIFPERQLLLQSSGGVRHLSLPGWLQAMVLAACLISVGGIAYLAVGFARLHEVIDSRVVENPALNLNNLQASNPAPSPAPVVPAPTPAPAPVVDNTAIDSLRKELAQMRDQLAAVGKNYSDASARADQTSAQLAALTATNVKLRKDFDDTTARIKTVQDARDDADRRAKTAEQALQAISTKTSNLAQLTKSLDDNKAELQQSEAQRTTLQNRVQQLQMELQAQQSNNSRAVAPAQTQAVAAPPPEPKPAAAAPTNASRAPAAAPAAAPAVVSSPDTRSDASVPRAPSAVSELERLLASTGLDINRMLGKLSPAPAGQGGPYIALNAPQAAGLDSRRIDDLKQLAKVLPLASPLNSYQLESTFGGRVDPINHRSSFHPGLDMSAPYMTQVFSTGAGVVSFTGTEKDYGRVVEIDHGHGIVTRFAHLHRILVARGQKVGVHFPIGELGSTGRSTGPHVHYEVHVDGSPVDPAKFMEAGKNVVQISTK